MRAASRWTDVDSMARFANARPFDRGLFLLTYHRAFDFALIRANVMTRETFTRRWGWQDE